MIRIHNSLSGRKDVFTPLDPGHVRMYVCGITVYDFCHIGHARSQVTFDLVRRYLQYRGFRVTYVRNITDIDDKIIRRAAERGESIDALTNRFIAAMDEDFGQLNIRKPDHEPRATEYVPAILRMIGTLIDKGHAYVAADGDVLYSVSSFAPYGALSGKRLEDLRAGARVEVDAGKRDPLDFVLWKASKPGEPAWDSPWGAGRPGWHIECSAMSTELLGSRFDIHGGGMDLKFPHHENEIAQSCAATDDSFAHTWMHNGFVNVDDEKMSKSLNNFFTLREVLPSLRHPEVMRYFLLSSHYRGPINYALTQLEQADAALTRLYTALRGLDAGGAGSTHAAGDLQAAADAHTRFEGAMDDDFNSPEALAVLQGLAREINAARAAGRAARAAVLADELKLQGAVLGVLGVDSDIWLKTAVPSGEVGATSGGANVALDDSAIDALVAERIAARKARNWAESDRLRDVLAAAGVVVEDGAGGKSSWRRG